MVNIVQFVQGFLQGELARQDVAIARSDEIAAEHAQASIFETLAWLHLGVELRYFDLESATYLLDTIYEKELLIPLRSKSVTINIQQQSYSKRFYKLAALFPSLEPLLFRCVDQGKVFGFFEMGIESPKQIRPAFQCFYLMAQELARDTAVQNFIAGVNFTTDATWDSIVESRITPEDILTDRYEQKSGNNELMAAPGFIRLLQYMERFRAVTEDMHSATRLPRSEIRKLADRVKMMQGWRTGVLSESAHQRIRKLCTRLDDQYGTIFLKSGLPKNFLGAEFARLRNGWLLTRGTAAN